MHNNIVNGENTDIILFIDDNIYCHQVANLIIANLTKFKVINAYTGATALNLATQYDNKVKLIFLDILMPDMRGDELYKELLKNPKLKNIPIVFQSGISENSQNDITLLKSDNVHFLQKPYDKVQLLEVIDKLTNINYNQDQINK